MTTEPTGLRARKKEATRRALREAALRLARERGPDDVRVDDIAEAAGVSPRTYNNYFASRERAIVAAVVADREARVAAAVAARPASVGLADAVVDAIVDQYTDPGGDAREALLMITTHPGLRTAFVDAASAIDGPLADAIARRLDGGEDTARVLAASVAAAVHVALERWVRPAGTSPASDGLVVATTALPGLLRSALAPLRPALDAAETSGDRQE